jgi:iron complex outermembrane receptor protein
VARRHYGDLLRSVPGVNVTQISARDINVTSRAATSSLSTSQLAVVDGRSIYQDFFGFIMWDFMPTNLNEIKQIEVIRGPASAVWGANAVNGVINVITKSPREMQGTSVTFGVAPSPDVGRHRRRRLAFYARTTPGS